MHRTEVAPSQLTVSFLYLRTVKMKRMNNESKSVPGSLRDPYEWPCMFIAAVSDTLKPAGRHPYFIASFNRVSPLSYFVALVTLGVFGRCWTIWLTDIRGSLFCDHYGNMKPNRV